MLAKLIALEAGVREIPGAGREAGKLLREELRGALAKRLFPHQYCNRTL